MTMRGDVLGDYAERAEWEYKTTEGSIRFMAADSTSFRPMDPIVPEGGRWTLCGAAANDNSIFWFWKRARQ